MMTIVLHQPTVLRDTDLDSGTHTFEDVVSFEVMYNKTNTVEIEYSDDSTERISGLGVTVSSGTITDE